MKLDCSSSEDVAVQLIKELRDRIPDIILNDDKFDDDLYLHRWLINQQSKVDRAETAIREALIWREENKVDILAAREWDTTGFFKELPVYMDPFDKNDQPVVKVNGDNLDFAGAIKKFGKETSIRFIIELYAKFEKLLIDHYKFHKANPNSYLKQQKQKVWETGTKKASSFSDPSSLIVIGSFKDFSLWNAKSLDVIQVFFEGAKIGIKYFPCLASDIYITNTNQFSAMMFRMMKPLLSSIPSNVECYDCNEAKWSQKLRDTIRDYPLNHDFYILLCKTKVKATHRIQFG